MKQALWNRVGPVADILSFGLTFIGASMHGFPDVRPTDAQLAKWLTTVDLNTFAVGVYVEDLSGPVYIRSRPLSPEVLGRQRGLFRNPDAGRQLVTNHLLWTSQDRLRLSPQVQSGNLALLT